MYKKLLNFPNLNILTIKSTTDRQKILDQQIKNLGLSAVWHNGYELGIDDELLKTSVTGKHVDKLKPLEIIISLSHLKMVKQWYDTTSEPFGLFCEDDINFDCVQHWNFTWDEYVNSLPADWSSVQMVLVKETPISNYRLQKRTQHNWSAAAYLITRSYAKVLIDSYIKGVEKYELTIPCHNDVSPVAENILFQMAKPNDYTFPVLTENVDFVSTFHLHGGENSVKIPNQFSEYQAKNWWKTIGYQLTIDDLVKPAIPVIGTAVVNSCHWVTRLLMSIDYPVDNFVIINNNGRGDLDDQLENLKKIKHKWVKKIIITNMPSNIGCSGAWNLIIKSFVIHPYWLIVNDDVAFTPGLLREIIAKYQEDSSVDFIHPNAGDFNLGSWDLFLMTEHAVRKFGLFDENFYPAYCEDADYIMRLAGRSHKKVLGLNKTYYHGMGTKDQYEEHGSQTKKNEPAITAKVIHANLINWEYMKKKWGENWRTCSPYSHPFNNDQIPITYCSYDIDYVRKKHLGF